MWPFHTTSRRWAYKLNIKCLAQAVAEKSCRQHFQGEGYCGKVKVRRNVTVAHSVMKMSLYTKYEMPSSRHCRDIADKIFRVKIAVARSKCDKMWPLHTPTWRWVCMPNMKCLAPAVAEKLLRNCVDKIWTHGRTDGWLWISCPPPPCNSDGGGQKYNNSVKLPLQIAETRVDK